MADELARFREEYESENAEIKIVHDQDDFLSGQQYILTIQDQPVLVDDDVNPSADVMVNVELATSERHKHLLKAKAKVKRGNKLAIDTSSYDDSGQVRKPRLLDKYDVEEEEKEGMVLNLASNKVRREKRRVQKEKVDKGQRNEMVTKKVFKSDFVVDDENAVLNLGGEVRFRKKGKKRNLKRSRKILDGIEELLGDDLDAGNADDLKTKEERERDLNVKEMKNIEQQHRKQENYEKAVLKANIKTRRMFKPDEADFDDDYLIIQQNIEKQRRIQETKQNEDKKL
uniref:Uncharacterized protein n=2 Tax=Euplotes harpa TaxID=151035 RepID=A0A7S3JBA8_9SPIT